MNIYIVQCEFYTAIFNFEHPNWSIYMSKMFQVYGIGQALIPVLPPPLPFENPPTVNQTNYEIGQLVYSPPQSPTAFFLYGGAGNWIEFATSGGDITAINGTASQVAVTTVAGIATISLPAAITTPGSLATTTSLASGTTLAAGTSMSAGTSITAGTTLTATLGNITATNGNLVLGTAGNKISIATGSNASVGTSGAMTGGAVTVSNSSVTAASKIFCYPATLGTVTVASGYYISAISAGVNFTITSSAPTDTSTWTYLIIN
jgi:hypothetical protein